MRRISVPIVAALLSLGVVVAPGAAFAGKVIVKDGHDDNWSQLYDGGEQTYHYDPVGTVANTDVVRTTVEYTSQALKLTVDYDDLVRGDVLHEPSYKAWFKLASGKGAVLTLSSDNAESTGSFLWKPTGQVGRQAGCTGVTAQFHWSTDRLTATLPKACVGNPAWVKFHGIASSTDSDGSPEQSYLDGAQGSSYDPAELQNDVDCFTLCKGWTGKIKRG